MALATGSTIIGTYLNMLKDPGGFIFWMGANAVFIAMAFKENEKWTMVVFSVYFLMAVIGLWIWIK